MRSPKPLTRALRAPGVWKARRFAEVAVTPRARIELERLDHAHQDVVTSVAEVQSRLDHLAKTLSDIEASLPAVLNAISSMNGASRMVKRELDGYRERNDEALAGLQAQLATVDERISRGDVEVLGQVRPHVEALSWLMQRVETVRFEMLNELRYGAREGGTTAIEPRIVNPDALTTTPLRLNIGAGHVPMEGYVNVDMRELPGIDVIATVDALPFEPGTVDEIYSSHTLEHFPQETLRRQLLPYWTALLKPGGTLVTVAPDLESMSADYARGDTPFEDFREVVYGGQEYDGDTHFTGFTPSSLSDLLEEAGLVKPVVLAADRRNGKCKEFEVSARKAS